MVAKKNLIVEDELIIAANFAMQIESFGYQVIEPIPRAEEVLSFLINNTPYIILLDINLKGHMAVQITRQGYNDFKWLPEEESLRPERIYQKLDKMSTEELKAAVRAFSSGYFYAGDYTGEDTIHVVNHHRISTSIHSPVGNNVPRAFAFSGDTIILRALNGNRRLKCIKHP